jgi:DNA-binding response OmpR family regulator
MPRTILLVEDEYDIRRVTRLWLEKLDYQVIEAANGNDGWGLIRTNRPDVVLTDITMPGMDGVELCRLIKSTEETADTPVIMFTSHAESEIELRGTNAGADAYLVKGADSRVLQARIEAVLTERSRQTKSRAREVDTARRKTLSQTVITLAHHLNNSLISIHATASVVDHTDAEMSEKLKNVCLSESRKMLTVLKALRAMAEQQELKTTVYVGDELMFDLEDELGKQSENTTRFEDNAS